MKLILIRHGQSKANFERYIAGRMDVSLSKKGIEQAKRTAEALKDEKINICFCSPLKRAKDTAKEILKFHDGVRIVYDERIINRSFGEAEGKKVDFLFEKMESFEGEFDDFKLKNGETVKDLVKRIKPFLNDIFDYESKTVLLVAHNWIIRVILSILTDQSVEELFKKRKITNASIIKLELKNGKFLEVI